MSWKSWSLWFGKSLFCMSRCPVLWDANANPLSIGRWQVCGYWMCLNNLLIPKCGFAGPIRDHLLFLMNVYLNMPSLLKLKSPECPPSKVLPILAMKYLERMTHTSRQWVRLILPSSYLSISFLDFWYSDGLKDRERLFWMC